MTVLDQPDCSLPDIWAAHARARGSETAIVCGGEERSWAALDGAFNRIAHAMLSRGLGRGARGAVLMANSITMIEVMFGIVRAGACVVPLSGLLTPRQLAGFIADADASVIFVSSEYRDAIEAHRDGAEAAAARCWVSVGFRGPGWIELEAFLADAADTPPPVRHAAEDDFSIIYSSGTTDLPKGIVHTHRARLHFAFSNAVEMGFDTTARALTTTPLYSNGTWLMILPLLFAGGTLHILQRFSPPEFLATVAAARITHTFMVPTQYGLVLAEPSLGSRDLGSLKVMLCAGSTLRLDRKREILERIGPGLHELYGFSEGFATMLRPAQREAAFDTVGTPVLGFEVRIIDEHGRARGPGEAGEIVGHGPGMMRAYHRRRDATADIIWRDERGRTFLRSGDIGVLDARGFLRIIDRKKDVIISGGFNIFPSDIEATIGQHPAVSDSAVIAVPHAVWGEAALACVIRHDGQTAAAEEIQEWCNQRLGKHQRVVAVQVCPEFPRNALGKVLRRVLREQYRNVAEQSIGA